LAVAFNGDDFTVLSAEHELFVRVDVGHRVEQLLLKLDVGGVIIVPHSFAELNYEVPAHELAVSTVEEVYSPNAVLLLEAVY
jgi:hypothetical protein